MSGDITADKLLGMSDDDFLDLAPPNDPVEPETPAEETQQEQEPTNDNPIVEQEAQQEEEADAGKESDGEPEVDAEAEAALSDAGEEAGKVKEEEEKPTPETPESSAKGTKENPANPEEKAKEKEPKADATGSGDVDYESFYKQVMAPFKANGKTITLRDPSEVIGLMQMGANYTKKLQDLQPHRKMVMMLQDHDLLDEGKLSYLIDLSKKDPEAIKKLIKDSGIDPMDIDTESEPTYLEGNHKLSDTEVKFRTALEELNSNPEGTETLQIINDTWDKTSKDMLWDYPQIMETIHQQRANGVYDLIANEVERQRILGQIAPTTPFIEAYKIAGDKLQAEGAFGHLTQGKPQTPTQESQPQERVIVDTRVATPKSTVANGDKASAASPSRSAPRRTKEYDNPLAMPDDQFLKQFENRL